MTDLLNYLWAAPAALGFAMFFNVKRRALLAIAVLAILGKVTSGLLLDAGATIVLASFCAALVVGMLAFTIGPRTREASSVYAFAPVIPLIPGTYIFTALAALVTALGEPEGSIASVELLDSAAASALIATAVTLALAVGATSPKLLFLRDRPDG